MEELLKLANEEILRLKERVRELEEENKKLKAQVYFEAG